MPSWRLFATTIYRGWTPKCISPPKNRIALDGWNGHIGVLDDDDDGFILSLEENTIAYNA
jgi:hypothetical protein